MKFYIVENAVSGETLGCEKSAREAVELADAYGLAAGEFSITEVVVTVNAETIRRLLGGCGGYARSCRTIR